MASNKIFLFCFFCFVFFLTFLCLKSVLVTALDPITERGPGSDGPMVLFKRIIRSRKIKSTKVNPRKGHAKGTFL